VYGVDYAPASVEVARRHNASAIALGRVDVRHASVSTLPFDANIFDIATAIETHYYWPSLDDDVREILRVHKPGGTLLLIAEIYRGRRFDWIYRPAMAVLGATYLTPKEHGDVFRAPAFPTSRCSRSAGAGGSVAPA
jgi:SAM-dependent methyltransferase